MTARIQVPERRLTLPTGGKKIGLNVEGPHAYYSAPEHDEASHLVREGISLSDWMHNKREEASQWGEKCADSGGLGARRSAEHNMPRKQAHQPLKMHHCQCLIIQSANKNFCFLRESLKPFCRRKYSGQIMVG